MKKVLAIILSIAMLFGVLAINTFAETTKPTITIDCGEAVKVGETTTINVKLTNFSSVKGMDLTVTASTTGVKFTAVTCEEIELKLKDNYTLADQELHIVDLNSVDTATIAITATVTAAANVTAAAELAKDGKFLFAANEFTVVGDDVVINTVQMNGTENGTVEAPVELNSNEDKGYFIPYGSVYVKNEDGSYTYVKKDPAGIYNITESGVKWNKFEIPNGGFGTFAFSTSLNAMTTPAVQFATYSNKVADGVTHGTLMVFGNWAEFKILNEGLSEAQLAKAMSDFYDNYITEDLDGVKANFGDGKFVIIKKVVQKNYMYRSGNVLEYSLRINGLETGVGYAAVGYYTDSIGTTFSNKIQSYTYNG